MSIMERIRSEAARLPEGQPVTTKAFMFFGSRASVDQALSRLVKAGVLSRPARGVYVRPKRSAYVGAVPPEPIQIAEATAAESGYTVQVHGAEAARRMGFTTQVPTKPIFYTSGPSRSFRLGAMEVSLKHISPRKLALAGRPAGIALTALWYLGKEQVTSETIEYIRSRLAPEEFKALCAEVSAMPGWMHDVILKYTGGPRYD
jgi:hypothetical protein